MNGPEQMTAEERATLADDPVAFGVAVARLAADNKAYDVVVQDLRGLSAVADVFVLGTGTSPRQMDAIAEQVDALAAVVGRKRYHVSGTRDGRWVLADYVDVVLHLFDEEHRGFYDLDSLWGDAQPVRWERGEDERAGEP